MNNLTTLVGILVVLICIAGFVVLVTPMMEVQQIEAETEQIEAKVELTEAETSQESQKALSEAVKELLTELRAERRIQREQFELLVELLREREKPSYTWVWVGLLAITGGIVTVLLLHRHERIAIMLPPSAQSPWLPSGSTDVILWKKRELQTIQEFDEWQEIAIE